MFPELPYEGKFLTLEWVRHRFLNFEINITEYSISVCSAGEEVAWY